MRLRLTANNHAAHGPVVGLVIMCLLVMAWLPADFSSREEWRRTAQGWERSGGWLVAASGPVESLQRPPVHAAAKVRLDTHPVVLAFARLISTLLAIFATAPLADRPLHGGLISVISRSFRASVFGS